MHTFRIPKNKNYILWNHRWRISNIYIYYIPKIVLISSLIIELSVAYFCVFRASTKYIIRGIILSSLIIVFFFFINENKNKYRKQKK